VMNLMRKAGIRPTITTANLASPVLKEIAPGERRRSARPIQPPTAENVGPKSGGPNQSRRKPQRPAAGRNSSSRPRSAGSGASTSSHRHDSARGRKKR